MNNLYDELRIAIHGIWHRRWLALGVAWATLVASELIAAQRGLGAMIQNASTYFLLDVIYVGIICIGCIALIMDMILRKVSARLLVWQERAVA